MNRNTWLTIISLLANLFFESILIVRLNLFGIRPDTIVAVLVPFALVTGSVQGAAYGLAAGLTLDVLFGSYLGMYSLGYVLIGFFAGLLTKKHYVHNPVAPTAIAFLAYFFKEGVMALQVYVLSRPFSVGMAFWRYLLPSAAVTSAISLVLYYIIRRNRHEDLRRSRWGAV